MSRKPNKKRVGEKQAMGKQEEKNYLKDQDERNQKALYSHIFERVVFPTEQVHKYNPLRWRQ